MLFCYISRPKTYLEPKPNSYENIISSFIQCQLISTPTQLNLSSISTKPPLNLISTSFQPQVQINPSLNSTSTITSTQYGCDIKATQSCPPPLNSPPLKQNFEQASHYHQITSVHKQYYLFLNSFTHRQRSARQIFQF